MNVTLTALVMWTILPECGWLIKAKFPEVVPSNLEVGRKLGEQIVGRVRGRILGCLIRKGMTTKEVEQILGKDPLSLENRGIVGSVTFSFWRYYTYGLTLSYAADERGILRVDDVSFWPISD